MNKSCLWVLGCIGLCLFSFFSCTPRAQHYVNKLIYQDLPVDTNCLPPKNKAILVCAAFEGPCIAPTYKTAVCTEYLIKVLEHLTELSTEQKTKIRIITDDDLCQLLEEDSPITKGVYYSLTSTGIGEPVDNAMDVKAGDLVQFWDYYGGKARGHCGIVRALDLEKGLISLYSSSITTNGHGVQLYVMPQYAFYVRLK